MLQYHGIESWAVPHLPIGWKAPQRLLTELGIFSGRLYFKFEEYDDICEYLGLEKRDIISEQSAESPPGSGQVDGFARAQPKPAGLLDVTKKPLTFLQEWLTLRRKGQDFTHTPMGYICQGWNLREAHHFFRNEELKPLPTMATVTSAASAARVFVAPAPGAGNDDTSREAAGRLVDLDENDEDYGNEYGYEYANNGDEQ